MGIMRSSVRQSTRGLIPHTARSDGPAHPSKPGQLDKGIRRAVEVLQANGVETFESCEGGPGHAYPEPTVAFYGTIGAGWAAIKVCLDHGLPVLSLRMVWDVLEGLPTGPHWEVTFRRRIA